jgi:hypothetical protein
MDLREQFIKSAMDSCRHFNGVQNKTCNAGVQYEHPIAAVLEKAVGTTMPCIPRFVNGRKTWPCELFEIMSQADAEKEADERIVAMNACTTARHAAKDDAKEKGFGKGRGGASSIPCPSCDGGVLRYSVASYNGHMHGKCSTPGCVSWME